MTRLRRGVGVLLAAAALALVPAAVAPAPAVADSYCGLVWGSLPERADTAKAPGVLYGIRAGRHACYDRLVFDIAGPVGGYHVRYVSTVRAEGSGQAVPVAGGARLQLTIEAPSYDNRGSATYAPRSRTQVVNVGGWDAFRQVAWAGSFEGHTTVALGVRARLPMRVFILPGDDRTRVVVDVAHRW